MADYTSLELLGHGVFSSVYLAKDAQGKKVALKYYTNKSSAAVRQKFMLEASTLSQIHHDNILKVLDFGEDEKGLFQAIEYCSYGSLKGRIELKGALDLERTVVVGLSVLQALRVLHNAGKIHNDIRPENLFNSDDGFLKLADLGTLVDKTPLVDLPPSAVYYSSPELLERSEKIDFKSDFYSLGATLYHIYTGKTVYEGEDTIKIVNKHLTAEAFNISVTKPECPQSFANVINKLMAHDPEKRFTSHDELEEAFQLVLNDREDPSKVAKFEETNTAIEKVEIEQAKSVEKVAVADTGKSPFSTPIQTSSKTEISVDILGGKDEEKELKSVSKEPKQVKKEAKPIDFSKVKLHWHMKLLVVAAWLVGPAILGYYVYDSYFSNPPEENTTVASSTGEELVISSDAFAASTTANPAKVSTTTRQQPKAKSVRKPKSAKLEFVSFKEKFLPIELVSVDTENFFASVKTLNSGFWSSKFLVLGEAKDGIQLVKLNAGSAIVDYKGKAYQLDQNQKYSLGFDLTLRVGGKTFSLSDSSKTLGRYSFEGIKNGVINVRGPNGLSSFQHQEAMALSATELSSFERLGHIHRAKGGVISLVKFDHSYFPLIVNAASKTSVNYSLIINGIPVNYGTTSASSVIGKRYKVRTVSSAGIEVADLIAKKLYTLQAKQKLELNKAAVINYKSQKHKVSDGDNFFGYEAVVAKESILFESSASAKNLSQTKLVEFLSEQESSSSSDHKLINCNCLTAVTTKRVQAPQRKPVEEKKVVVQVEPEKTIEEQLAAEIDLETARRKPLSFEHFMMFSNIKFVRKVSSGPNSYSLNDLGVYLYKGGKLINHPKFKKTNQLKVEDFEVTSRSIKYQGNKFKYQRLNYDYGIQLEEANSNILKIEFVPNNYFTLKRVADYITFYLNSSYYYFGESYVRTNGGNRKIRVKFNDEEQSIYIDNIAYKPKFTAEEVYLVDPNNLEGELRFSEYMYYKAK
ncbi:MAG: serine/threonine protein kinase [Lentisphaeraceae bacterium]|nr:serine/threonine protein kinase [Lentisphaeraceae bacterium]